MDFNKLFQAEVVTDQYDSAEMEQLKVPAILAYIPFLFFIPMLKSSGSQYSKFISNQGLTITVIYTIAIIISKLFLIKFLSPLISFVALALSVLGIADVLNGRVRKLPIIHQFILQLFK